MYEFDIHVTLHARATAMERNLHEKKWISFAFQWAISQICQIAVHVYLRLRRPHTPGLPTILEPESLVSSLLSKPA